MRQKLAMLLLILCCLVFQGADLGAAWFRRKLVRRTQAIFDSVAGGDQGPWKKYLPTTACTSMNGQQHEQGGSGGQHHTIAARVLGQNRAVESSEPYRRPCGHS